MKIFRNLLIIVSLSLILATPHFVLAQENKSDDPVNESQIEARRKEIKDRVEQRQKERQERIASNSAKRKAKLEANKLRICENRSERIKNRSERLASRAEKQLTKFTSIAERVDNFYLNKLVPKGVTVSNYDTLKADIEARKQEVKDAIEAAKAAATGFDCSGEDPKGQLETYREEMKDAVAALKDFRTSIKNFIVAVRTAAAKNSATSSAEGGE